MDLLGKPFSECAPGPTVAEGQRELKQAAQQAAGRLRRNPCTAGLHLTQSVPHISEAPGEAALVTMPHPLAVGAVFLMRFSSPLCSGYSQPGLLQIS